METIHSFKMFILLKTTQCYNPEDCIPHNHCCENLKSSGLNSSGPGQGPRVGPSEKGNELSGSIKCWKSLEGLKKSGFSSRNLLHAVS
jgi:hypothetical protein